MDKTAMEIVREQKSWLTTYPPFGVGPLVPELRRLHAAVEREAQEREVADSLYQVAVKERNHERVIAMRAEARAERLAAALRRYGKHDIRCPLALFAYGDDESCSCGLNAALREGEK